MPTPQTAAPAPPEPLDAPSKAPALVAKEMPYLVSAPAELYLWNIELNFYERQAENVDITARIVKPDNAGPYDYWLVALSSDGQFLAHHIDTDLNQRYAPKMLSLTWNHVSDSGLQSSWCFRFAQEEDYNGFMSAFTRALWETLNQSPYEKIKVCNSCAQEFTRLTVVVSPMSERI